MSYSVNEEEKFWDHLYKVWLSNITEPLLINADNEQDALDFAVDYAEEQKWFGYFLDQEKTYEENPELIDVIAAGNHCLLLPADEIHIEKVE